jgi:hypothetical protein
MFDMIFNGFPDPVGGFCRNIPGKRLACQDEESDQDKNKSI